MVSAAKIYNEEEHRKSHFTDEDREDTISLFKDFLVRVPPDLDSIIKNFTYGELERWRAQYIKDNLK